MASGETTGRACASPGQAVDLLVTLLLWSYFTVGFVVFFLPSYLAAALFSRERETAFQRLNQLFYRGLLGLLRVLAPRHSWRIDDRVARIRSSVIVCNHLSYLDPLIMIALFRRHKTIVKARLFRIPIFGWFLKNSGYMPAAADGALAGLMVEQFEKMREFLAAGGNLFVFPQGTRSQDGQSIRFGKGAFAIARHCRAPIRVVRLRNTDRLFPPGRFLFRTLVSNRISLDCIATFAPDANDPPHTLAETMEQVRALLHPATLVDGLEQP